MQTRVKIVGLLAMLGLLGCVKDAKKTDQTRTEPLVEGELFSFKGKTYSTTELSSSMRQNLFEIEMQTFKSKQRLAEEAALEMFVAEQAQAAKKTEDQIKEELFKVPEPKDAEVKAFYEANKERIPPNLTFDQVKGEIKKLLMQQSQSKARDAAIAKLKTDHNFSLLVAEPEPPSVTINTEGRMVKGNEAAKVVIVEFADYGCAHCRATYPDIKKLVAERGKDFKFVFIDFPLGHGISGQFAQGAFCAGKQSKFWEYHDLAFTTPLTQDAVVAHAKKLSLNEEEFKKCSASDEAKNFVESGRKVGEEVGVNGTPSIFINGKRYMGMPNFEGLASALDNAVKM